MAVYAWVAALAEPDDLGFGDLVWGEVMGADTIEFYREGETQAALIIKSSFAPDEGDLVNMRGQTWEVLGRSFTIDRAWDHDQAIRCNVIIRKRDEP